MPFNIAGSFAKRAAETAPKIEMIDINKLIPNEGNFYRVSDEPDIERQNEQTKASIEMYGILQPLRIADNGDGKYKIIVGERRYLACKRLIAEGKNFKLLPCIVEKAESPEDEQIKLIITNQHRETSNAERLEEVRQLTELIKKKKEHGEKISGSMDKIIADMLNISKSEVGRLQQVNKKLEPELKTAVKKGNLSMAAATELSKLSPAEQKAVYEKTGGTVKAKQAKEIQKNHNTRAAEPENMNIDGFMPLGMPKPDKVQQKKATAPPKSQTDSYKMTKSEIIERLTAIYESMLIGDEEDNEAINQAIDILVDLPDSCFDRKEGENNGKL